jgi:hypothetical protein
LFLPSEPRISIYVWRDVDLALLSRGWVGFHKQSIFEPGEPQRAMPAAFFFFDARLNGPDPESVA